MTAPSVPPRQNNGVELYGIQMLRALAALAIVTHHFLETFKPFGTPAYSSSNTRSGWSLISSSKLPTSR